MVYINGQPLQEPYVHFLQPAGAQGYEMTSFDVRENYGPVTVPPGNYFMMGDNRDNSQDSRYWGFLPASYIKGKALMVYWSYDGEPQPAQADGLGGTVRDLFSTAIHFFTRTRWDRLLHQIR